MFRSRSFSDFRPGTNIYLLLAWRFLLVMFIFSVCRVAFFLINHGYFPNTTFGGMMRLMQGGLVFDTSAVLYTNLLYFGLYLIPLDYRFNSAFQRVMKYLFIVTNSLAIVANCADFIYFQFAFRRTTASIFSEFRHESNLGALMPKFIVGYWYVVLIGLSLIALVWFLYGPPHSRHQKSGTNYSTRTWRRLRETVLFLILGVIIVGGLRGNLRHSTRPITLSNAGKYIREPLEANIVLNTPFAIYRTLGKQFFEPQGFYPSEEELEKVFTPIHIPDTSVAPKRDNVVILILESFGCEYTSSFSINPNGDAHMSFTPFLDSLIGEGLMFTESFSNGRKSIDAMPSALTSIPMMTEPFLLTPYSSNKLNSLASLLGAEGYHTAFFHGAPNGSMGFDSYANAIGFHQYYGMDQYPDKSHFDGSWGIWDEEFFQFYADKMNGFQQPFCTALFSVSSHHPFVVPDRYKGKFPDGEVPIHQCIAYTDYALRRFFETASKMPWYPNTLFVITGDHTSQSVRLAYKTNIGAFRVPVVFFKPDGSLKRKVDGLAQQIDIMPSVLGYLGYSKPFLAFGRNLFDSRQEPFVITYTSSTYQLVMDNHLFLFNGQMQTGFYAYRTDTLLTSNAVGSNPELERKMEGKIKAFIQQYNNRMITNRMTVDSLSSQHP